MEENRPLIPAEEVVSPTVKSRRGEFLSQWQGRLHEMFSDKPESNKVTKETEKSVTKEGRISRAFHTILAKLTPTETLPIFDFSSVEKTTSPTESLRPDQALTDASEPTLPEYNQETVVSSTTIDIKTSENINLVSTPTSEEYSIPPKAESYPEDLAEVTLSSETVTDPEEVTSSKEKNDSTQDQLERVVYLHPKEEVVLDSSDTMYYEQTEVKPPQVDNRQQETVEHYLSGATAKQLEIKADQRNYKLKREVRKSKEEIKQAINKDNKTKSGLLSPLEAPMLNNSRIIERVPQQRITRESTPNAEVPPDVREKTYLRAESPTVTPRVEVAPERKQFHTPEISREREQEVLVQRSIETVESSEPIEKSYERRHEIVGEEQFKSAVPIGSIVQNSIQKTDHKYVASQLASAESIRRAFEKQNAIKTHEDMYSTAVRSGAIAAVVIIVFAIIAYLVAG